MDKKVKLTMQKNIKLKEETILGMFLDMLSPSRSRGSTASVESMQKSKILNTMAKDFKRIIRHIKLVIIVLATISVSVGQAKDFGTRGHTYKIVEQGFLEMIDERLQKVDMEKEQKKMIEVVKDRVANPVPVKGINPATKHRTFSFYPTYILEKDIVLRCGKILHRAGTKVNALEEMQKSGQSLDRRMFFVDASRARQIKWLKKQLKAPLVSIDGNESVEDRIILIGGSPFKLKEELGNTHKHEVYFDQNGAMTSEFGIKASPAVVVQDGLGLKIKEIMLTNRKR